MTNLQSNVFYFRASIAGVVFGDVNGNHLLTSGEQDTTDPPSSANADYAYYKAHCGCDVTQLLLPNTAHLFMVHRSLPSWVDYVVGWLGSKGLAGAS